MMGRARDVLPFLCGLVLFAAIAVWCEARGVTLWRNYALSGIGLGLPSTILIARADLRVPYYIQWTILAALLLHYVGGAMASADAFHLGAFGMHGVNGAYHVFPWWDHVTHGVGIGAIAMGCAYAIEIVQVRHGLRWSAGRVAALAFACGLATGVFVELYEYTGKVFFQTIDQGGYANTAQDLQFNLLGSAVGAGVGAYTNRRLLGARIQAQWQAPGDLRRPTPRSLRALTVFVAIPAATSLLFAARGFWVPGSDLEPGLYDGLLRALGVAMAAGAAASLAVLSLRRAPA